MTVRDHAEYDEAIGAYVLDALPELEAEVLERHMLHCETCREQVERLRPSVDALPRAVPQLPAPPGLKAQLMADVRADAAARKPTRSGAWSRPWVGWATAAAAAVVLGFAVVGVVNLGQGGTETVTAMVDTNRLSGAASAQLDVLEGGDAAILKVKNMPSPGPGRVYQVWLRHGERIDPGPTFVVDRGGNGAAAIPQGTDGADAVMVTRERAGGATRPGEIPVIVANV